MLSSVRKWDLHSRVNSLRFKVLAVVLSVLVLASALLFVAGYFSNSLLQKKIYEADESTLQTVMRQYDADLSKIRGYLANEFSAAFNRGIFSERNPSLEYNRNLYYSRYLEQNNMFDNIEGYGFCTLFDSRCTYTHMDDDEEYPGREYLVRQIKQSGADMTKSGNWVPVSYNGRTLLLCVIGNDQLVYFAWTSCGTLLKDITINAEEGAYYFTDPSGAVLAATGEVDPQSDSNMVSTVSSTEIPLALVKVTNTDYLLKELNLLRWSSYGFLLAVLVIGIPVTIALLTQNVFRPVQRLERGMAAARQEELDVHVDNSRSSNEMIHLTESFNQMVDEIRDLKIQSYEEELEKQKLQLNAMQLQIEPHFYLNALNLIGTMAQMGDTELIHTLIENLSAYLRYIVSTSDGRATIREELDHVDHYMNIMQMRFGDNFRFEQEIDRSLGGAVIPPLLIQMLVENSMKYAFDVYGSTVLRLSVHRENGAVVIVEEDNGPGYPDGILEQFRENRQPEDNQHIGLWNVRQRLYYMYPGTSEMILENTGEGGARTRIRIPGEEERR